MRTPVIVCIALVLGILAGASIDRFQVQSFTLANQPSFIRIDRLTGESKYFLLGRWLKIAGDEPGRDQGAELPSNEVAKIKERGSFTSDEFFSAKIYNGSSWVIDEVELCLGMTADGVFDSIIDKTYTREKHAEMMSEKRVFRCRVTPIRPLCAGDVAVPIGWHDEGEDWLISRVFGSRSDTQTPAR